MQTEEVAPAAVASKMTPQRAKLIVIITAIYLVFPFDIVPDPLPLIGQVDDLVGFLVAIAATRDAWRAKEASPNGA